jgi:hypothetical protein
MTKKKLILGVTSDKDKMNAGGFYEGMPGATLDENGYRKMIDFVVTPDGDNNAIMYAHPHFVVECVEKSMEHKELKDLMLSALVNHLFKKKSPFQFFLRLAYRMKAKRGRRAYQKAQEKAKKHLEDESNQSEQTE